MPQPARACADELQPHPLCASNNGRGNTARERRENPTKNMARYKIWHECVWSVERGERKNNKTENTITRGNEQHRYQQLAESLCTWGTKTERLRIPTQQPLSHLRWSPETPLGTREASWFAAQCGVRFFPAIPWRRNEATSSERSWVN